jgi:hypothetical protein
MKCSVVPPSSTRERIAEPLPEGPVSVWSLTILTGAVNLLGRNEILHMFLAGSWPSWQSEQFLKTEGGPSWPTSM